MTPDPYKDWLQIRDSSRPLTHYCLLGISESEQDASRIQAAYGRQMEIVRRYQVGAHMDVAQRVISELSEAFATLTHPQQRLAYDVALRGGPTCADVGRHTIVEEDPPAPAEPIVAPIAEQTTTPEPRARPAPVARPTAQAANPESAAARPAIRRKKKQSASPALIGSIAAGLFVVVLFIVWASSGDTPSAMAPAQPKPVPKPASGAQLPRIPPPRVTEGAAAGALSILLATNPSPGSRAEFSGFLRVVAEGEVTVAAKAGDAKSVRVTLVDAPQSLFERLGYTSGAEVQVIGVVAADEGQVPPWKVIASQLQRPRAPTSRIDEKVIAAARPTSSFPAATDPAIPTAAPSQKPVSPATPPIASNAAPAWDKKLAAAEDAWSKARYSRDNSRVTLSGAFIGFQAPKPSPSELKIRLRFSEVAIKGPFLPEAETFLQQLKADEHVDLEVSFANQNRSQREPDLEWISRADAPAEERIACRRSFAVGLVQTLAVAPMRPINALLWSPNGDKLLVAAQPTTLWDASTGMLLATISNQECQRAAWSADGKHIALVEDTGGGQDRTAVFEAGGKLVAALPVYAEDAPILAASPNAKRPQLALAQRNLNNFGRSAYSAGIMSFAGKPAAQSLGDFGSAPRLAWSSDGTYLALAASDNNGGSGLRVLKLGARNLFTKVQDTTFANNVTDLRWAPGGTLLAVCTSSELAIADPLNPKRLPQQFRMLNYPPRYSFSADGRYVAVIVSSRELQVCSLEPGAAPLWQQDRSRIESVAWSPTRPLLASIDSDGTITIASETGLRLMRIATGLTNYSRSGLAWSPDGNRLATFGQNDKAVIYDVSQLNGG